MDGDISGRIGVGSVVYPESSSECYSKAQAEWKECYQIVDIDYFSCTASNCPDCGTKRIAGFDACDKTYKEASTLCCQTRCNEYKAVCYISAKRNYDACKNSYSTSIYNFFVVGNYCLDKYEIDQKNCDKARTDCNTKCAQ